MPDHREPGLTGDPVYTPELYAAIGRVAASSAELDELLRELLDVLLSPSEWAGMLAEGQPTDWLIRSLKLILGERDPYNDSYAPEQHAAFLSYAKRADWLRERRNSVIHGYFRSWAIHEGDEVRGRPWGLWDDDKPFTCSRSRRLQHFDEQWWTLSNVNRLADELHEVAIEWAQLMRAMEPVHRPMKRWIEGARPPRVMTVEEAREVGWVEVDG